MGASAVAAATAGTAGASAADNRLQLKVPQYNFNSIEVSVHERGGRRTIVGTQLISLGDFSHASLHNSSNEGGNGNNNNSSNGRAGTPPGASANMGSYANLSAPIVVSNSNSSNSKRSDKSTSGGSGGGDACTGRALRYHDPLYYDVDLALEANLKAARLVIKRASNLPSSSLALEAKKIPPTVYATVYLVGANGEKRSVNSADSRTDAIKSFDPEWNKEVLLQNEKQGLDDITAVMVLFRDSSVGYMKHHHIGRVNIPFSCFLDNVQADFCLPLEPTYR